MKKILNNAKSKIMIVAAVLAVTILAVGITMAFYHDSSNTAVNTFTVGNVTTEIVEIFKKLDDHNFQKEPRVTNTGENDCYIRIRYQVTPSTAEERLTFAGKPGNGWTEKDGWYYYTKAVEPGESTTPLFTKVTVDYNETDKPWIDFDIILYQEAVQAEIMSDGSLITDMNTIWKQYDAQ